MRIDVYKDRQLVATFVPDAAPIYRGAAGSRCGPWWRPRPRATIGARGRRR